MLWLPESLGPDLPIYSVHHNLCIYHVTNHKFKSKFTYILHSQPILPHIKPSYTILIIITFVHSAISFSMLMPVQSIIYCLCRSYAVLVPSLSDLTHLCTIIQSYLKSTHLFVRNATLRGLLCLLESCVKTNTTIGGLSDELLLIRNIVINYITKYGIIEER